MNTRFLKLFYQSVFLVLLFYVSACSPGYDIDLPEETPQEDYQIDTLTGSDNATTRLNQRKLSQAVHLIQAGAFGDIHSLIVIHNDELVLEEYFRGWTRHMLHPCASVTKSFASALIGIAIDQGLIEGVDETLLGFFPEYAGQLENTDERKEAVTLEQVLTMTAGFAWDETSTPYYDEDGNLNPDNDVAGMIESSDWVKYILDLPLSTDPGAEFVYNSGCSHLLSGILTNRTGETAEGFAEDNLFNHIGITAWQWGADPQGITTTGFGLQLHPVNLALFGYLYLKKGSYAGAQIVSETWVDLSTDKHVQAATPESEMFYGYQWWRLADESVDDYLETNDVFCAIGYGGQFIFVIPHLDMVVVSTAANYGENMGAAFGIVFGFIVPAVEEKE